MNRYCLKFMTILSTIGFALSLFQCSSPGESNGSSIGNAAVISGKLYEPDGITPAINASVKVWDVNSFNVINKNNDVQYATPVRIIQTDENGCYSIDRIDNGMYNIEASDQNNNMARVDSITVDAGNRNGSYFSDTLKAPGTITGKIVLEGENDTNDIYVTCSPSYKFLLRKTNTQFIFEPLAEGVYRVEFNFWSSEYDNLRLIATVSSGKTTDLGVVKVLKKLPSIDKITIDYYPLLHRAVVGWNAVYSSIFAGYNLYRRVSGDTSFGEPINGSVLITDTSFVDSNLSEGVYYEYSVRSADSRHHCGPFSRIVSTSTFNAPMNLDTFDLVKSGRDDIYFIVKSKDPDYLYLQNKYEDKMTNKMQACIQKYSVDGNYIGGRKSPLLLYKAVVDENDQIFYDEIVDSFSRIMCIDAAGNERTIVQNDSGSLLGFDASGNSMVFVTELPWNRKNATGAAIYRITRLLTDNGTIVYSKEISVEASTVTLNYGTMFLTKQETVEDSADTCNNEVPFYGFTSFLDVRIDKDGTVRLFLDTKLRVFDPSGQELASMNLIIGQNPYTFSDSHYLLEHNIGYQKRDIAVYDFSNKKLFWSAVEGDWIHYFIAQNGDIYISFYDARTGKSNVCRLKNPIHTM